MVSAYVPRCCRPSHSKGFPNTRTLKPLANPGFDQSLFLGFAELRGLTDVGLNLVVDVKQRRGHQTRPWGYEWGREP